MHSILSMGEEKSSKGRLHAVVYSGQFFFDILLIVVIIWLLVQVQCLKNDVVYLRVRQSECEELRLDKGNVEIQVQKREAETDVSNLVQFLEEIQGPPGPPGIPGRDGRDAVNLAAVNNHINSTISTRVNAEMKRVEEQIDKFTTVSGAVYIRYGRTSCPSHSGLLYEGRVGGTHFLAKGGSSQYICLPDDPEYSSDSGTVQIRSMIYGTEYQLYGTKYLGKDLDNHQNVPCAVCQTGNRANSLMIPAKLHCPDSSWTLEYKGSLMAESNRSDRSPTEFVCVDENSEPVSGMHADTNGALLYHTDINCQTFGHCPPYQSNKVLSCVVCSK